MLTNKFLSIILSFFIILSNSINKILIPETLVVDSITLTENELIELIIDTYNIPTDYNAINISTNYFNSPEYNQIYGVELIAEYENENIIYNLKLKPVNKKTDESSKISPIFLISSILIIIILLSFYKKRSN